MKFNNLIFFIFLAILINKSSLISVKESKELAKDDYCYGLALEGGGDRGAWQIGALKSLYEHYPQGYQVFSGVSIGAFNSVYLSTYKREQQKEAIDKLIDIWHHVNQQSFYQKPTWYNIVRNLFTKVGIYDNSPYANTLHNMLDNRTIQTLVSVGVVSLNDGQYKAFDLDSMSNIDKVVEMIKASGSVPAFF